MKRRTQDKIKKYRKTHQWYIQGTPVNLCKNMVKIQSVTIEVIEWKILNWKVESILVTVLSKSREGKILKALILTLRILFQLFPMIVFNIKMEFRFRAFMLLKEKKEILLI